jgi:hypothetical protein
MRFNHRYERNEFAWVLSICIAATNRKWQDQLCLEVLALETICLRYSAITFIGIQNTYH